MPEAFGFPEGNVYIYTGNATPSTSAVFAYARDTRMPITRGWDNRPAANGTYYNHLTGQRCDVSINAVYTVDSTLAKIHESATAIHMKFIHTNAIGSAGYFLYSGRIASLQYVGNEKSPFMYTFNAIFNAWSAF
jgi:hypothetical protein